MPRTLAVVLDALCVRMVWLLRGRHAQTRGDDLVRRRARHHERDLPISVHGGLRDHEDLVADAQHLLASEGVLGSSWNF